mgnify:CR=1 FL=1
MARSCPKLQELWISSCVDIADWEENKMMIELYLPVPAQQSGQVTNFGVTAIAHGCPALRSFVMQNCHRVTPSTLGCLQGLQLRQLSVIDCFQFRCAQAIEGGLVDVGCPTMRRLHLISCDLLDTSGEGTHT